MMSGLQLPWPEPMLEVLPEVLPEPMDKSLSDHAVPETTPEEMLDSSKPSAGPDHSPAPAGRAPKAASWAVETDSLDSEPVQPHPSPEARTLLQRCNRPWAPKAFWLAAPAFSSTVAAPLLVPPPPLAAELGIERNLCEDEMMSVEVEYFDDGETWLSDRFLHHAEGDDGGELQHTVHHVTVQGGPAPILMTSKEARFARRAKTQRLGQRVCFPDPAMTQTTHDVTPYSEVYGVHPRQFEFDAEGNKIHGSPFATKGVSSALWSLMSA